MELLIGIVTNPIFLFSIFIGLVLHKGIKFVPQKKQLCAMQ